MGYIGTSRVNGFWWALLFFVWIAMLRWVTKFGAPTECTHTQLCQHWATFKTLVLLSLPHSLPSNSANKRNKNKGEIFFFVSLYLRLFSLLSFCLLILPVFIMFCWLLLPYPLCLYFYLYYLRASVAWNTVANIPPTLHIPGFQGLAGSHTLVAQSLSQCVGAGGCGAG